MGTASVNWHETFASWARAPSETEESKAERAARMVRETLRADSRLAQRDFEMVAVGSYRNNTNVRASSDVDLAAVLRSTFWYVLPADGSLSRETLQLTDASYTLAEFRRDITNALRDRFGARDVAPGRITLTLDESGARLGADVTPYLIHRRYTGRLLANGQWEYHEGIETRPDGQPERRIIQWPEQHYASGVGKNTRTNRRYKRIVRILKCLRDRLAEDGTGDAAAVARTTKSCFIEHAVFNVPDDRFNRADGTYYDDVCAVVGNLWNAARDPGRAAGLVEVSDMQRLFRDGEPWSPKSLENFMLAAWGYVGFKT